MLTGHSSQSHDLEQFDLDVVHGKGATLIWSVKIVTILPDANISRSMSTPDALCDAFAILCSGSRASVTRPYVLISQPQEKNQSYMVTYWHSSLTVHRYQF